MTNQNQLPSSSDVIEFNLEGLHPDGDVSFEYGSLDEFQLKAEMQAAQQHRQNQQRRHRSNHWA
jgi:hypothetical protein